jgi:hypothetical protein
LPPHVDGLRDAHNTRRDNPIQFVWYDATAPKGTIPPSSQDKTLSSRPKGNHSTRGSIPPILQDKNAKNTGMSNPAPIAGQEFADQNTGSSDPIQFAGLGALLFSLINEFRCSFKRISYVRAPDFLAFGFYPPQGAKAP